MGSSCFIQGYTQPLQLTSWCWDGGSPQVRSCINVPPAESSTQSWSGFFNYYSSFISLFGPLLLELGVTPLPLLEE